MTRVLNRFGLALVLWLTLVGVAQADVITVTRNDDRVGGACALSDCTLREAIASAQPGDTVQLGGTPSASQVYTLSQGTHLLVDKAITIAGGGPTATAIDGGSNFDTLGQMSRIMRTGARDYLIKPVDADTLGEVFVRLEQPGDGVTPKGRVIGRSTPGSRTAAASTSSSRRWPSTGRPSRSASSPRRRSPST